MLKKLRALLYLFIILIFVTDVNAKEDIVINKFYIISEPELAGALDITEVIEAIGNYSEFDIDLRYKDSSLKEFTGKDSDLKGSSIYNGTNITLNRIGKLDIKELDYNDFIDVTSSFIDDNIVEFEEESEKTYKQELDEDKLKLRIYNSDNKTVNYYYIKYSISNMIVEHKDYAELKYYYLDGSLNYDIKDLMIFSNLPFADPNFKIWVHGPRNGEALRIEEGNGAILKFENIKKNAKVDIRMLYDLKLFPLSINESKKSNMESLSIIEKIEEEIKKSTDKNTLIHDIIYYSIIALSIFYTVVFIIIAIREVIRNFKQKKIISEKYYKKGFNDITDIMNITNRYSIDAYLLDMLDRDVIKYIDNNVILNRNSKYRNIDESLINYLFKNEDKISIVDLNRKKKNIDIKKEINNLKHNFNSNFYNKMLYIVLSLLGLAVSIMFIKKIDNKYMIFGIILGILSFILLIYSVFANFYSKENKELFSKYKGFIRYIKDLEKDTFDLKLFSNYLIVLSIKNKNLVSKLNYLYEKNKLEKIYKYEKVLRLMQDLK